MYMSKRSHKVNQTNQALDGCPIFTCLKNIYWKIIAIYYIYSFVKIIGPKQAFKKNNV